MSARGLRGPAVVYALLFAVLILLPFDFHVPASREELRESMAGSSGELSDLFQSWFHAVLFLPLGVMFRMAAAGIRPRVVRFLVWSVLLAAGSEAAQIFVDRSVSLGDAVADLAGAVVGFLAYGAWRRSPRFQTLVTAATSRPAMAIVMVVMLAGSAVLVRPVEAGFDDWDPTYRLLLGNEEGGERPWFGILREVAVYAGPEAEGTPVLRYSMALNALGAVFEDTRSVPGADMEPEAYGAVRGGVGLEILDDVILRSRAELPELARRIREAGAFTLVVRFAAARADATGPARIVTYSGGPSGRNFTLGQEGSGLVFRVRTTTTGANGTLPSVWVGDCVRVGRMQTVVCVSDGARSVIYLEGERLGEVRYRRYPALVAAVAGFRSGTAMTLGLLYVWWAGFGAVCRLLLGPGSRRRTAAAISLVATAVVLVAGLL